MRSPGCSLSSIAAPWTGSGPCTPRVAGTTPTSDGIWPAPTSTPRRRPPSPRSRPSRSGPPWPARSAAAAGHLPCLLRRAHPCRGGRGGRGAARHGQVLDQGRAAVRCPRSSGAHGADLTARPPPDRPGRRPPALSRLPRYRHPPYRGRQERRSTCPGRWPSGWPPSDGGSSSGGRRRSPPSAPCWRARATVPSCSFPDLAASARRRCSDGTPTWAASWGASWSASTRGSCRRSPRRTSPRSPPSAASTPRRTRASRSPGSVDCCCWSTPPSG